MQNFCEGKERIEVRLSYGGQGNGDFVEQGGRVQPVHHGRHKMIPPTQGPYNTGKTSFRTWITLRRRPDGTILSDPWVVFV